MSNGSGKFSSIFGISDVVKFVIANVTGKLSAIVVSVLGFLYMVAPDLPTKWQGLADRAQVFCISILLAIMFWKSHRIEQMIVTTQAENKIENPHLLPTSADPAVQRQIEKIKNGNGGH